MLDLLNDLISRGASQEYIRIISVVVAPPALNLLSKQYPGDSSSLPAVLLTHQSHSSHSLLAGRGCGHSTFCPSLKVCGLRQIPSD